MLWQMRVFQHTRCGYLLSCVARNIGDPWVPSRTESSEGQSNAQPLNLLHTLVLWQRPVRFSAYVTEPSVLPMRTVFWHHLSKPFASYDAASAAGARYVCTSAGVQYSRSHSISSSTLALTASMVGLLSALLSARWSSAASADRSTSAASEPGHSTSCTS